jgi:hypothetical protein
MDKHIGAAIQRLNKPIAFFPEKPADYTAHCKPSPFFILKVLRFIEKRGKTGAFTQVLRHFLMILQ